MKFIDQIEIFVRSGDGGSGMVSFKSAKNRPKLGPDGGDGGDGGNVFVSANPQLNTLSFLRHHKVYKAENGDRGGSNGKTGKGGNDLVLGMPLGTIIYNAETNVKICEILHPNDKILIASGGRHGLGNIHFLRSTHQAPEESTKGEKGLELPLRLELKLLADIGLTGLPNAGKSTILSRISAARPRIADYPFTTLTPNLGVVELTEDKNFYGQSFVVADIPGLIEGASQGKGLGIEFLKHVERTKILAFIVDAFPFEESASPLVIVQKLEKEIKEFNPEMVNKKKIIILNKIDLAPENYDFTKLTSPLKKKGYDCILISGLQGTGLVQLKRTLYNLVQETKEDPSSIVVFGGAFDPPHQGHLDCVEVCAERFPDTEFWILPTYSAPGLRDKPKKTVISFEKRLRLCEAVFARADVKNRIKILPLERTMPEPNYTFLLIEKIFLEHSEKKLYLLLGQDQLQSFARWKKPKNILKLANIIAIRRQYLSQKTTKLKASAQELCNQLTLKSKWIKEKNAFYLPEIDRFIFLIDKEISTAESTLIRQQLLDRPTSEVEANLVVPEGIIESWLPGAVKEMFRKG